MNKLKFDRYCIQLVNVQDLKIIIYSIIHFYFEKIYIHTSIKNYTQILIQSLVKLNESSNNRRFACSGNSMPCTCYLPRILYIYILKRIYEARKPLILLACSLVLSYSLYGLRQKHAMIWLACTTRSSPWNASEQRELLLQL